MSFAQALAAWRRMLGKSLARHSPWIFLNNPRLCLMAVLCFHLDAFPISNLHKTVASRFMELRPIDLWWGFAEGIASSTLERCLSDFSRRLIVKMRRIRFDIPPLDAAADIGGVRFLRRRLFPLKCQRAQSSRNLFVKTLPSSAKHSTPTHKALRVGDDKNLLLILRLRNVEGTRKGGICLHPIIHYLRYDFPLWRLPSATRSINFHVIISFSFLSLFSSREIAFLLLSAVQ